MKTALVMLGYQLLWFIVVIGAARGWVAVALLWAAALLGAVGGPLAYAGAARGFHVITFPSGSIGLHVMAMWWAACWVVAFPLLLAVGRRRAHPSYGAEPTKDQRTDG